MQILTDLPSSNGYHYTPPRGYSLSLHGPSPQLQYGPPSKITQSSNIHIPGELTIEDLIRLTEKLQNEKYPTDFLPVRRVKPQKFVQSPSSQQNQEYLPPTNYKTITNVNDYSPSNQMAPSTNQQYIPATNYKTITNINNYSPSNQMTPPRTSYGLPIEPQKNIFKPQNQYGVPGSLLRPEQINNKYRNLPLRNQESNLWKNNYNSNKLSEQYLPIKEAGQFKPHNTQASQNFVPPAQTNSGIDQGITTQDIPSVNQNGFGIIPRHPTSHFTTPNQGDSQQPMHNLNTVHQISFPAQPNQATTLNVDYQSPYANTNFAQIPIQPNTFVSTVQPNVFDNRQPTQRQNPMVTNIRGYIPPTTTVRNVFTQVTTELPNQTTEATTVSNPGIDNQFTEPPPTSVVGSDPNVSIATAVAGADPSLFYLQQPDGRLQKVILQKTQDPRGKPEEYTAHYYFQNIEPVPNTIYSPLITVG